MCHFTFFRFARGCTLSERGDVERPKLHLYKFCAATKADTSLGRWGKQIVLKRYTNGNAHPIHKQLVFITLNFFFSCEVRCALRGQVVSACLYEGESKERILVCTGLLYVCVSNCLRHCIHARASAVSTFSPQKNKKPKIDPPVQPSFETSEHVRETKKRRKNQNWRLKESDMVRLRSLIDKERNNYVQAAKAQSQLHLTTARTHGALLVPTLSPLLRRSPSTGCALAAYCSPSLTSAGDLRA